MGQGVVFEILAVYIVHDNIVQVIIVSIIKNTHNVRITQLQENMSFALKTCQKLAIVCEFKMHNFDCIDAIIFGVARNIDGREAATPKLIDKFVAPLDDTSYHVTTHTCSFSKANPRGYYTPFNSECHGHVGFLPLSYHSVRRFEPANGYGIEPPLLKNGAVYLYSLMMI